MGIKFKSPLELSAHRAIAHSDSAQVLTVTVATKTTAHPQHGNGSTSGYVIDGVEGPYIELTPGNTYQFDQSDSTNTGHPLRFYEDAAKTTAYTTGVTTNGTPGTSGAYTQIIATVSTPPILFYQCSAHSLMGSYVKFGTGSQGDTYSLSATQDGSNVDILLDAGSGTDSTVQLTAGTNITLTRNNAQEVTIASTASGGGGAELNIERNVFTATANQTAFTISSDITASSNTQVYIDGVYQAKSNYTTSGSVVTFSTGVPLGSEVEVVHFIAVYSKIYTDTFTGNGSTTQYTTSKDVSDENETQVYIDGVYQSKDNYTTSGTTVTFSTAPPNGTAIEVVHFDAAEYTSLASNQFTGTGSQTAFTLTQSDVDEDSSFVFIQGVYQEKSTYSISGSTLTFTTAPINGYTIEVITAGVVANVTSSPVTSVNGQTGAVTVGTGTDWDTSIKTADFTAVAGKGYFINTTSAQITVTLPSNPSLGDAIELLDYSGTAGTNKIVITSSNNIEGSSDDKAIKTNKNSAILVYSDATKGWVASKPGSLESATDPLVVDYLVIAGGGSGSTLGGGGGAGGYRNSYNNEQSGGGASSESALTNLSLSTNYTVTVGAGGAATADGTYNTNGNNGANSVFASITSVGGGGGSAHNSNLANIGGSGGGGSSSGNQSNGAAGTANQGYAGGNGQNTASGYPAGGGGGAGGVGGTGTGGNTSGNGGAGLASSITGSSVTRAGGGGGAGKPSILTPGTGAAGGGSGVATSPTNGTDATANSGSGGGGGGYDSAYRGGGAGGSGIVILRYPSNYYVHAGGTLVFSTTTDGNDRITSFTAGTGNITFETTAPATLHYLVVAGGGGGGFGSGGAGAGAGGLRTSYGSTSGGGASSESSFVFATNTNYTVTVGSGGNGGIDTNNVSATNGNNSVFSTITSIGGGKGGSEAVGQGPSVGGSGGGGNYYSTTSGAAGTANQGYAGGDRYTVPGTYYMGGGGGGAGAVGGAGSSSGGGAGGDGLQVSITGTPVYYAGGGGGESQGANTQRAGGQGGGGTGGTYVNANSITAATSGTANTGGGGGGGTNDSNIDNGLGGNGGAGIVILRYPNTKTITIGAGLTGSTATDGSDKVTTFTAGTGTISFS